MTTLTVSPRGFTEAEFERRCSAAQQIMLEQNLDAMLSRQSRKCDILPAL